MVTQIKKRDGRTEPFCKQKIIDAILAAMDSAKPEQIAFATVVAKKISDRDVQCLDVEQVQDLVEQALMESEYKDVARRYIVYRAERTRQRNMNSGLIRKVVAKTTGDNVENANANVDEHTFGGRRNEAASIIQKEIALESNMPKDAADAHKNGLIYQHDLDFYNVGGHNCFTRETKFLTEFGIKSFCDFEDGDIVTVMSHKGNWQKATVRNFGTQNVSKITLRRGDKGKHIHIFATPDHRWLLKSGEETTSLSAGMELINIPETFDAFNFEKATVQEQKAWCKGFGVGDGVVPSKRSKKTGDIYKCNAVKIRLCGEKTKYLQRFIDCGYTVSKTTFDNDDVVVRKSGVNKTLPDEKEFSKEEHIAFIHGLFAADGWECKNNFGFQSSNEEVCAYFEKYSACAGLHITCFKDLTGQQTNYATRKFTKLYRILGRENTSCYKVVSVEPCGKADVWCLQVEKDNSFILEGGIPTGNCLFLDFKRLFENGFKTRNCDVRPPNSLSTACQLVAVALQLQSQCQFGGCASAHIDTDLAPFVKKSFFKHFKDGAKYIEHRELPDDFTSDMSISDPRYVAFSKNVTDYAFDMLNKEGKQSAEGLYHNLGTLESRAGSQVPFSSLNLGRDTSAEGRLVSLWLLNASINGIGKHHRTPIFPITIFSYKKGVNTDPGDPNYDLKQLALKSMSMRLYPNWANGDWSEAHEDPDDPDTIFATMGCRSMIGYDRNGLGYTRVGRGNNVPITIILPKLGIEYGTCLGLRDKPDLDGFWAAFEDTLKLVERAHMARFAIMANQSPKAAPFMYENGTIKGADDCKDTVYEALKHGTFAIGFIGVAEMCQALFGANHVSDVNAWHFAMKVVTRINEYAKEASERTGLNWSCYATPAENLCRTAMANLQRQYGTIENVTSREYLTNSFHVPVWEKVSIYDKLRLEAPFTRLCTGGTITYIECDSSMMQNTKAIESIIDYAMQGLDIPYLAINFPIDTCNDCGYSSEFNDACPECGSENITQLRRVTGYLSSDYRRFNAGKQQEVRDRVKHSDYTIL